MKSAKLRHFQLIYLTISFAGWTNAQQPVSPQEAMVKRYCLGCHNGKVRVGGLALDEIVGRNVSANPEQWEKVIRKLSGRYMPPPGAPRPDDKTYDVVIASLAKDLDGTSRSKPDPGRPDAVRRLTRAEYKNAVRDLLDLDVDVGSLLPADEASHGFDNITVVDLSPTLLEKYLAAAEKIGRLAVGGALRSAGGDTIMIPVDLTQEEHFDELPPGTRGGASIRYTFPLDATYGIQLRLTRNRDEKVEGLSELQQIELLLDGEQVKIFTVTPPLPKQDNQVVDAGLNIRIPIKAGPHTLAVTFPKKPTVLLDSERQPYLAHFNFYRHPRTQIALYSVSITGRYDTTGPGETPSRKKIFVCKPGKPSEEDACAKWIMTTVMRRAFRRPLTEADLQPRFKFYADARAKGGTFDAGIERGLTAILVSPEFIFRVESDPAGMPPQTPYKISDIELTSRLSFFLWSSIPDDELMIAAVSGQLRTPGGLEKQVRRMLADERSRSLVTNFAEQWLYLRNLANSTPDMRLFPDFDDNLRQAFRKESEMFIDSIMREDRPIPELLSAKYTFLNERLAKHYGVPNIYGSRFRRFDFPDNSVRGGLLGQGSILTVTSYATRTSPVIRGKWVLANILGVPPPPPPPNVPALKDNTDLPKPLSVRERLALHRAKQPCAGCHRLMDPVGFSLENYDAVGRWRTIEEGKPIDSTGGLPDGSTFEGVAGLKKALLAHKDQFVSTFTEKIMTYALGRGLEYYDAPAVRNIVNDAKAEDSKFSSIVLGVVNSVPFQMRRTQ